MHYSIFDCSSVTENAWSAAIYRPFCCLCKGVMAPGVPNCPLELKWCTMVTPSCCHNNHYHLRAEHVRVGGMLRILACKVLLSGAIMQGEIKSRKRDRLDRNQSPESKWIWIINQSPAHSRPGEAAVWQEGLRVDLLCCVLLPGCYTAHNCTTTRHESSSGTYPANQENL